MTTILFIFLVGFSAGLVVGIAYTLHEQQQRREWLARRQEREMRRTR